MVFQSNLRVPFESAAIETGRLVHFQVQSLQQRTAITCAEYLMEEGTEINRPKDKNRQATSKGEDSVRQS